MTYQIKSGPTSFDAQSAAVKRKQAIADAMLQSAMQDKPSGQMVSGHYVGSGLTNSIGSILEALMSSKMSESAQAETESIASRKQQAMQDELAAYMQQQQGAPAATIPQSESAKEAMAAGIEMPPEINLPQQAPDRRAAAIRAVASQFPQLQALGQMDLQELTRPQKPVQEEWRDPVAFERDGKQGLMMTSKSGNTKVLDGYSPIKKEPLVNIKNNVGENSLKGLADSSIKRLEDSFAKASAARTSFEAISNLMPLADSIPSGTGADYKLALMKLGSALGLPDDGSISSTEQISAALGRAILDNAKALGINPTDYDAKKIEKIVMAGGNLDANTIKTAMTAMMVGGLNTFRAHDELLQGLSAQDKLGFSPELLSTFKVDTPGFTGLSADLAEYDPRTRRFVAKPFAPGTSPVEVQAAKNKAAEAKTPATPKVLTAAELLAKRRGGQ